MNRDLHRMDDGASVVVPTVWTDDNGIIHRVTEDITHTPTIWKATARVEKRLGEWTQSDVELGLAPDPYEIVEAHNNLLMTAGATALWNGLSTAGLATPFSTTNAQLAVGDGSTAPSAADTDLSAAAGTTRAVSAATNASPIVLTVAAGTTWTVGMEVVVASVGGNTAANGTWEISATNGSTSITLLNSTGNGVYTSGGTAAAINKYRQQANASGSAVVTTNQIVYVATFGTANANHAWNEWGVTTGAAATNKQGTPPPTLFNRATPAGGLGTKTSAASWTLTTTLSLA